MTRTDRQMVERPTRCENQNINLYIQEYHSLLHRSLSSGGTPVGCRTPEGKGVSLSPGQLQDSWKRSRYLLRQISLDPLSRMDCTSYTRVYWDLVHKRYQCPKDDTPGSGVKGTPVDLR